jgi:hypothetical protein
MPEPSDAPEYRILPSGEKASADTDDCAGCRSSGMNDSAGAPLLIFHILTRWSLLPVAIHSEVTATAAFKPVDLSCQSMAPERTSQPIAWPSIPAVTTCFPSGK